MRAIAAMLLTTTLSLWTSVGVAGQADVTPGVRVGPDVAYFAGTMTCEYAEHFVCEWEADDPRVTGTEELAVVTYGDHRQLAPWTAEGTLTTEEGIWRGSGQGMAIAVPSLLEVLPGMPYNYGDITYEGEGAYDGLVMHYWTAGTDSELTMAGWIAPAAD